jgi:hypothetical protein
MHSRSKSSGTAFLQSEKSDKGISIECEDLWSGKQELSGGAALTPALSPRRGGKNR